MNPTEASYHSLAMVPVSLLLAYTEPAEDVLYDLARPYLPGKSPGGGEDAAELLRDDLVGMAVPEEGAASFEDGEHFLEEEFLA